MHIPDGYLSPQTEIVFGAVMIPVWFKASRATRKVVKSRYVPLVAIGAAFSFLVMMFNVPIPDGTTAHAVGGVLAYGANTFNMAFIAPMVGFAIYRLIAQRLPLTSPKRALAAGLGAYIGLNAAALCAAIEFGVQPSLFHSANGTPLYAPFHLSQTIPAMLLAHLAVAGVVEFVITAGVVAYLQRANVPLLRINHPNAPVDADTAMPRGRMRWRWALVGIGIMVVLTPLGLLAPGGTFGEDKPGSLNLGKYGLKAVPVGLAKWNGFWRHAVLGGYGFSSGNHPVIGYLVSAVVGIVVISGVVLAIMGLLRVVERRKGGDVPDDVGTLTA